MTVSQFELIDAIENSLARWPTLAGRLERIDVPGVEGVIAETSGWFVNVVGAARLSDDDAGDVARRVIDLYAERRLEFEWAVGPGSTPATLGDALIDAGMEPSGYDEGLATDRLDVDIPLSPDVRVREATPDDLASISDVVSRGFETLGVSASRESTSLAAEAVMLAAPEYHGRMYVACLEGSDDPVGAACLLHVPGRPIALLGGAATLPEHRGRGVYRALLKRRFDDARREGATAAVIQASPETSAPICRRIGMRYLCRLDWYRWHPDMTSR